MGLSGAGRKAKGARRERATIKELEKEGYSCTKAGGSLGTWDIIGVHPELCPVLVQVKSNRVPGKAELLRMAEAPGKGCHKLVYVWIDYHREPDVYWVGLDGTLATGEPLLLPCMLLVSKHLLAFNRRVMLWRYNAVGPPGLTRLELVSFDFVVVLEVL